MIPQRGSALSGRILVTSRASRYVEDATAYEYDLIAVPKDLIADPLKAATAISRAIVQHGLWSMGHSFLLDLGADRLRDLCVEEQGAR